MSLSVKEGTCAGCGGPLWNGDHRTPKEGWQLDDGRSVCHSCCVKILKESLSRVCKEKKELERLRGEGEA